MENIILKIENLHKKFGELNVLHGINLEVKKGEVVALIGPSGTGKSTLLRCLNYLERPDEGRITIDNVTVDAKNAKKSEIYQLRRHSAMIFQNYNLFLNKDVLHNVMEPLITAGKYGKKEAEEKARYYLEQVGMADKLEKYPVTLSGGQQQRVAIARSLAVQPTVLLLDEPTSALDPEWVHEVLEVITSLARKHLTMLIVTHEMQFARDVADRVVFMENGGIVEQGPPEKLFSNPENPRTRSFLKLTDRQETIRITKSMNYKDMIPMFIRAGLELKPDEENPEGLLTCFELYTQGREERIGGASLIFTCDEFVIKTVAIEPEFQGRGLGTKLVKEALSEAKQRGATRVYLNAKVPAFYSKLGFSVVPSEEAPDISDCMNCHRYHNGCDSEIMKIEL